MQNTDDFARLLDAVRGGAQIPAASPFAPELRVAMAFASLAARPSAAFERRLGERLDAQARAQWTSPPRQAGFGQRFAAVAAAVVVASVVLFTTTPAGPAMADAVRRVVHVFVSEAPDGAGAIDPGSGVRPEIAAGITAFAAEHGVQVLYPAYLPAGMEQQRVTTTTLPSGDVLEVQFGAVADQPSLRLLASVSDEPFDLASQGKAVEGSGIQGAIDELGDPAGTRVLSWTDGQVLYQLFGALPTEELLRIAGSAN